LIHDFDDFPTPARLQETSRLFSLDLSAFCKAVAKVDTTREMAVAYAKECVTGQPKDVDVKKRRVLLWFLLGVGYE